MQNDRDLDPLLSRLARPLCATRVLRFESVQGPSAFLRGLRTSIRGMRAAAGSPAVRRAYRLLMFAITAVTMIFVAVGIYAVLRLTAQAPGTSWYGGLALFALRILGSVFVVLASPLFALFFLNTVTPFLAERVFFAGLRVLAPHEVEALRSAPGSSTLAVLTGSSRRLLRFLCLTLLVSPLSLVPIAGPVLASFAEFCVTAVTLGWELLDPYFDKRGVPYPAQLAYVRRNWPTLLGFATPHALLLAVPVIGPLFFGIAQAAAAALATDLVEPEIAAARKAPESARVTQRR